MLSPALFSSAQTEWDTPKDLFDKLDAYRHYALDAAASTGNHLTPRFYTKDGFQPGDLGPLVTGYDGLSGAWGSGSSLGAKPWTWCNPPYGRGITGKWVEKAFVEAAEYGNPSDLLLPARTDTRWFHRFIYNKPNVVIDFLPGRLMFTLHGDAMLDAGGKPMRAPFPSMVVSFCV